MFRLDHKTAIITGAGSGIGKAIALLFARQGAAVFILDVDETGGSGTADAISAANGKAVFYPCNVAIQEEVKKT